jgi:hypothetical protein
VLNLKKWNTKLYATNKGDAELGACNPLSANRRRSGRFHAYIRAHVGPYLGNAPDAGCVEAFSAVWGIFGSIITLVEDRIAGKGCVSNMASLLKGTYKDSYKSSFSQAAAQTPPLNTMASFITLLASALYLFGSVNGQAYTAPDRSEDAFSYVQPLNTTILGSYGHSPAVYPSRKSS